MDQLIVIIIAALSLAYIVKKSVNSFKSTDDKCSGCSESGKCGSEHQHPL
jgi:hypothetical protein